MNQNRNSSKSTTKKAFHKFKPTQTKQRNKFTVLQKKRLIKVTQSKKREDMILCNTSAT